jgi:hypothetical protein
MTIDGFSMEFYYGGTHDVNVFYATFSNTVVGNELNPAAWTLHHTASIETGAGGFSGDYKTITIPIVTLLPGQSLGFYSQSTGNPIWNMGHRIVTDGSLALKSNSLTTEFAFSGNVYKAEFIGQIIYTLGTSEVLIPGSTPLEDFINNLQPQMGETQTIFPLGIRSSIQQPNSRLIQWSPIAYQSDGGFYILGYGKDAYNLDQQVILPGGKAASEFLLENLDYAIDYNFAIQTFTPSHSNNQNEIFSVRSDVFTFRTGLNPIHRAALVALFEETSGEIWRQNNNWLGDNPEEDGLNQFGTEFTWYGVQFGLIDGRFEIIGLDLSQNFLTGGFPSSICDLPYLKSLKINGNSLVGIIPD